MNLTLDMRGALEWCPSRADVLGKPRAAHIDGGQASKSRSEMLVEPGSCYFSCGQCRGWSFPQALSSNNGGLDPGQNQRETLGPG